MNIAPLVEVVAMFVEDLHARIVAIGHVDAALTVDGGVGSGVGVVMMSFGFLSGFFVSRDASVTMSADPPLRAKL